MSEIQNIQESNDQILNDIQSLQKMEQQLFSTLESTPNLSSDEQKNIIEKMNQLSNMRVNLYQTTNGFNQFFENTLNTQTNSLKEQVLAIDIVENELNRSKKRLQLLEQERNNKIRLVEINNYFGDKYAEHAAIMKIIILMLIPVIILTLLNKKGILPDKIFYVLVGIVALIGGYFFWKRLFSIIMRDNMNYQTYNWSFDRNNTEQGEYEEGEETEEDSWSSKKMIQTCIGENCCSDGLIYDEEQAKCVTESFITEIIMNDAFLKTQPYKNGKIDCSLKEPMPFNN
jgi:hypothetical protein